MISIITPVNRVIAWFNLRLINVCAQNFNNWEWIILDNSEDGCVVDYVNRFFTEMQGINYPHCKSKIKVYHEPFKNLSLKDGRMGYLRNRCVELTTCSNDDFFVILDSDDFLIGDFLSKIDHIQYYFPNSEFITGQICNGVAQFENGGIFEYDNMTRWAGPCETSGIEILKEINFKDNTELDTFIQAYLNGFVSVKLIDKEGSLTIPYTNLDLRFHKVFTLTRGWNIISIPVHPLCLKKGAFLDKVGGFSVDTSREDTASASYPLLKNPVYIDNPCYMRCLLLNEKGIMSSVTPAMCECSNKEYEKEYVSRIFKQRYDKVGGDIMGEIVPIHIKFNY